MFFPAVGLVIGMAIGTITFVPLPYSNPVIIVLILILSFCITGGLHLDGLADTFDGFYGQRSAEDRLIIMKDSRVGVMGVLGLISIIALKGSLLLMVPMESLLKALLVMTLYSRFSLVFACFFASSARKESAGKIFIGQVSLLNFLLSSVFTLAVLVVLLEFKGVMLFFILIIPIIAFLQLSKIKIGGTTGDTLGALNEIIEVMVLVVLVSGLLI